MTETTTPRLNALPYVADGSERVVGSFAYPGARLLSLAGPAEVFAAVNRARLEQQDEPTAPTYRTITISIQGGPVETASGLVIETSPLAMLDAAVLDTLIVPGGSGIRGVMADADALFWLTETAPRVRRIASFGGAAFILAKAGLLQGRRCVTHWRFEDDLAREYPDTELVRDALFVRDGGLLSAAGASASVDLALHMVEEDFGRPLALHVAQMLVLSRMRPGQQPQLGVELRAQKASTPRTSQAADWIVAHIAEQPSVATVAARVAMSDRNFSRRFTRDIGLSPQQFIDRTRLETAQSWLATSAAPLEVVARRAGYSNTGHMAQAFRRRLHITPNAYRQLSAPGAG